MSENEKTVEENDTKDDCQISFSHKELVNLTREAINKIIESDPLLSGLAQDPTIEEVKSQTAVAQGQAITLYLNRGTLPTIPIVVPTHTTTVLDLRKAVKVHTNLVLKRDKIRKKISWKRIWKVYDLAFNGTKLVDLKSNIKEYGIVNKSELTYIKKYREKTRMKQR